MPTVVVWGREHAIALGAVHVVHTRQWVDLVVHLVVVFLELVDVGERAGDRDRRALAAADGAGERGRDVDAAADGARGRRLALAADLVVIVVLRR